MTVLWKPLDYYIIINKKKIVIIYKNFKNICLKIIVRYLRIILTTLIIVYRGPKTTLVAILHGLWW